MSQNFPVRTAVRLSLPVFFCYFPLGIVYGLLCSQAGYPWYAPALISLFALSGVMQFLALTMLPMGASLIAFALALIPLGVRNVFYGLTVLDRYKKIPWLLRLYLAHGLVDATYSIMITSPLYEEEKQDIRFIATLTLLNHSFWVFGSLFGVFVENMDILPNGLEFSLTAFLAAAATEQLWKKRDFAPIIISACAVAIALFVTPHHFFLGASAIALVTCLAWPKPKERLT